MAVTTSIAKPAQMIITLRLVVNMPRVKLS